MTERLASWHSYPKVHAMGHSAIKELLDSEVVVQEKIDGSQFSFGRFINDAGEYETRCRSKGAQLQMEAPVAMFTKAVETVKALEGKLHVGWTYRAEYLSKPKHNTLAYERTPKDHLILFDISTGKEEYLNHEDLVKEAARIGLECVPILHIGTVSNIEHFRILLDKTSILGGQKIEGVVVKNYSRWSPDGHAMMGKYVSEVFKEAHGGDWKERNPMSGDVLNKLCVKYRSQARWMKAVQRLKEAGQLEGSPRDIGAICRAVGPDILAECEAEIKQMLFDWAWPHVQRKAVAGVAEWYKTRLLELQFETTPTISKGEQQAMASGFRAPPHRCNDTNCCPSNL